MQGFTIVDPATLRPRCSNCRTNRSFQNYLYYPGNCRTCQFNLPNRIWIVDLILVVSALLVHSFPPDSIGFLLSIVIILYFSSIMVIDIEHRITPNSLIFTGLILGFISGAARVGIGAAIFGGIIGFLIMLIIYVIGIVFIKLSNRLRSSQLNEPALGFGDVLLGGVLGLMIGWPEIFNGLMLSILIAGAFSLLLLIIMLVTRKYEFGMAFPYAPFLILGAVYVLFF